jgi:hypothetical protein
MEASERAYMAWPARKQATKAFPHNGGTQPRESWRERKVASFLSTNLFCAKLGKLSSFFYLPISDYKMQFVIWP